MFVEVVQFDRPDEEPELSLQAARLILEIGNYKHTRDPEMILEGMIGRTTVAALDGYSQVIGTAGLRAVNPGLGMLEDVVSDPVKRGLGIGRKVVEAAESIALGQGITELNLTSSLLAVPFYRRLGYGQLGERLFRKFL